MEEQFFVDEIEFKDETLHLDIRNIENNPLDYKEWNKFAKHLIDKGNYYYFLYVKSKSEYAKKKLESLYDKSIVCSDKAIELNHHNMDSWYNKGLALSNLGQYKKAIKCYDRVIEIDPDYLHIWNIMGNTLNYLGKFDQAIKCYDRVIEKQPNNPIPWYNKGLALSNLGQYEKAIKCYDRVIENEPKNIDALNAKGFAFERLHKNDEAIMCYNIVIELDPRNIEALNGKGYALERLEKYEEAEQYYNRITEEYIKEIKEIKEKAIEFQKSDKYEEAIICYDRVISIDANNIDAWLNRGLSLYKLDKYEEAIICYDRVISIDANNIDALNAMGFTLEKLGDYDKAIKIFDKIIAQNTSYVIDTLIKKGHILMMKEKYQESEKCYNDALNRDPNHIFALSELHASYSDYTFQYDKALSVNERLLKNLSESEYKLDVMISLSEDYIKNGNYKQGRKIATETRKYIPNESIKKLIVIKFLIIASYLLEGKNFDGIKELDKFLIYYRNLDIDIKIEESQWNFKGLSNAISKNTNIDSSTKTILRNLIDLLHHGSTDSYKILFKTTAETFEKMNKRIF